MGGTLDDLEEAIEEPPRRAPNPKLVAIVFGVVGFLALIGILGAVMFLVRRSSAPPRKEPEPVASYAVQPSAPQSASADAPSAPSAAPSSLAKGFGWLTLNGPAGKVIVKGKPWGDSGTKLAVPCGHVWVGIALVDDKGKPGKTLTKPQSVYVKCGGETEATAKTKK
jgi:hypothetical protein